MSSLDNFVAVAPESPVGSDVSQKEEVKSRLSSWSSGGSEHQMLEAWRDHCACPGSLTFEECKCSEYQKYLNWEKTCTCSSLYEFCTCFNKT